MDPYLGEIRLFPFNNLPRGWLRCDGAILSISEYQALYSLLGTNYGGNGTTTFALPDLRGVVPMHRNATISQLVGASGGTETVTLTVAQIPNHNHLFCGQSTAGDKATPAGNQLATMNPAGEVFVDYDANMQQALPTSIIGTTGNNGAHSNMQPYLAMAYCICANYATYPPRS